MTHQNRQKILC